MIGKVLITTSVVLILVAPALEVRARVKGGNTRRARIGQRVKSLARKAGIILAPVRVKRSANGSIHLERWALSKKGKPIPKERRVQFQDGRQHHSEVHYVIDQGKLRMRKVTTNVSADHKTGATIKVTTVTDPNGTYTRTELPRKSPRPMTKTGAYARAVAASPVVHFLVATGAWLLALDAVHAFSGVDLHHAYAGLGALGTKGVLLALEARQTFKDLALGVKRPPGVSRRQWRLMRRHAWAVERRHAAVEQAKVVRDSGGTPQQVKARLDKARQASSEARQARSRLRALGASL